MRPTDRRPTRRAFLEATGKLVAGLGPGLALADGARRRALADARPSPPSERIRVGCIGVGGQGNGNLGKLRAHVVAVCDVDALHLGKAKERLEKAKNPPCAAFGDYRRLLDDKGIDAVVVSTPDHWHAKIVVDACAAGKDVYCEKPLSLTVADGQAMLSAARKHGRIVQTGSQQRSDPKFRLACELVRSGRIGKVHTVRAGISKNNFKGTAAPDGPPPPELDYDFWLGPAPWRPYNPGHVHYNFRFFRDYSGGQLTNWGAHHLDVAQWGLGMDDSGPVAIVGTAEYRDDHLYDVPERCEVIYTYANGVRLICGQSQRGGTTFEGDKGTIHVDRKRLESDPADLVERALAETDVHLYVSDDHHANWLECIRTRKPPICDVAIGHRSASVCHLGNIAIRAGRPIAWDPSKEEIVGDPEAAAMLARPYRSPWTLTVG